MPVIEWISSDELAKQEVQDPERAAQFEREKREQEQKEQQERTQRQDQSQPLRK